MPAPDVRSVHPDDVPELLALYVELADGGHAPADPGTATGVLEEILADPARTLVVATLDGRLVGTADVLVVANLTHGGAPWAIVENVVVARSSRRQGVGEAVMRRVVELARDAGCYKVQLVSGKRRGQAHLFYESLGFEHVAAGFKLYLDA